MTSQQVEQRLRTGEQMIETEADTNRRMELEDYWLRLLTAYERAVDAEHRDQDERQAS